MHEISQFWDVANNIETLIYTIKYVQSFVLLYLVLVRLTFHWIYQMHLHNSSCFVGTWTIIYPYSSGLCHCHWNNIDGLVQDCSNSIAYALELLQSCTKPSILWLSQSWWSNPVECGQMYHTNSWRIHYITTTKQSTTEPYVYCLGHETILLIHTEDPELGWWHFMTLYGPSVHGGHPFADSRGKASGC